MIDGQKVLSPPPEHPLLDRPEEERLREEVESLKKQLEEERKKQKDQHEPKKPKPRTLWIIAGIIVAVLLVAFFVGYLPQHRREKALREEALAEDKALPALTFVVAKKSPADADLFLPGNIEAITEAPILARADGFLKRRYVDIGDRVKQGQLLAEIEAPELRQQVAAGQAQLDQARASERQARANMDQGRANQVLAHVSAERWSNLLKKGAVSRQENDQYQAADQAQSANLGSLAEALRAAQHNVSMTQANLDRLAELQGYTRVYAPFAGIITVRNIDTGALITTGSTLLFRIAQIDRLRTFVYTPQAQSGLIQIGQAAIIHVAENPNRTFPGAITRTSNSLDPASRTMLTEVQIPNPNGTLLPGEFTQVEMKVFRKDPPILIPGDAIIVRANGTFVGVLADAGDNNGKQLDTTLHEEPAKGQDQKGKSGKSKGKQPSEKKAQADKQAEEKKQRQEQEKLPEFIVHLVPVAMGRDYGNQTEILTGLQPGQRVIVNPTDDVMENVHVHASLSKQDSQPAKAAQPNATSEKLAPQPGGDAPAQQPDKGKTNRGPGN
jgi:RND family efflux transporter MFP subunit